MVAGVTYIASVHAQVSLILLTGMCIRSSFCLRILDLGPWIQDPGSRILDLGSWTVKAFLILDIIIINCHSDNNDGDVCDI